MFTQFTQNNPYVDKSDNSNVFDNQTIKDLYFNNHSNTKVQVISQES